MVVLMVRMEALKSWYNCSHNEYHEKLEIHENIAKEQDRWKLQKQPWTVSYSEEIIAHYSLL